MHMTEVMHKVKQHKGRTAGDDRRCEDIEDIPSVWTEGTVSNLDTHKRQGMEGEKKIVGHSQLVLQAFRQ